MVTVGRRASRKRHADKAMEDRRVETVVEGPCSPASCVGETACKDLRNGRHTCLCTHDSRPPALDGTCPRRIVNEEPGRIPNVQPPSLKALPETNLNATLPPVERSKSSFSEAPLLSNFLIPSFSVACFGVLVLVLLIMYFKRKSAERRNQAASPMNLKHGLLVAERYAPNPQYSDCPKSAVPVLRRETLKFLNELGEGCFGKVFKGELMSDDGEEKEIVAIKVLKETASKEAEDDFYREVEIMSAFRHPNILLLLGVVLREGAVSPMMVFEYMRHGDLAEVLRSQRRLLDPAVDEAPKGAPPTLGRRELLSVALQVAGGMRYLAAQRFVHRDLACRNCLVADGPVVKIADFGMSRDVYTCDYYKIGGSRLLPVRWMSPESVVYGRFTLESDVWSYGVVLWEIYSFGKQPYYGHTNDEVVKLILDGIMLIPPEDCPPLICDLMKNCWKTEPRHRITFPNICDKLEVAFEGFDEKPDCSLKYENEMKKYKQAGSKNKSLPRPPPLKKLSQEDLLDSQGYLLPKEVKEPAHYLETLPD